MRFTKILWKTGSGYQSLELTGIKDWGSMSLGQNESVVGRVLWCLNLVLHRMEEEDGHDFGHGGT